MRSYIILVRKSGGNVKDLHFCVPYEYMSYLIILNLQRCLVSKNMKDKAVWKYAKTTS